MLCIEGSHLIPPTSILAPFLPPFCHSNFDHIFFLILDHIWAPKWHPKWSQNGTKLCAIFVLFFEPRFCCFLVNFWRQRRLQICSKCVFFLRFSNDFCHRACWHYLRLCHATDTRIDPILAPRRAPKRAPNCFAKTFQNACVLGTHFGSILVTFWDPFGDPKLLPKLSPTHTFL